jgi:hypothetical protein
VAVCPGFYFRQHYFILMLPAIALLAGVAVSSVRQSIFLEGQRRAWSLVPVFVFLLAFADSLFVQREYLFAMDPVTACQTVYAGNPFSEAVKVGEYLKNHTSPGKRIAVLGSEPEIYFYADRHSATGYIYTYSLMEPHKYAVQMQKEMIAEIEAARPEFVVLVNVPMSVGRLSHSETLMLSWADAYLRSQYEKVGTVDMNDPTDYVWDDAAMNYRPRSRSFINVFKRTQSAD